MSMWLPRAGVATVAIARTVAVAVAIAVSTGARVRAGVAAGVGAGVAAGTGCVGSRRGVVRRLGVAITGLILRAVTVTLAVVTVAPAAHRPEVLLGHASGLAAEGARHHRLFGEVKTGEVEVV